MTDTIQVFLKSVKTRVTKVASSNAKFHIILGNEACDLDSAACSIALAYYLHVTKDKDNTIYLPILNITREEYRLKTEVKYVLTKISVEEDMLVFRGDLNLKALCSNNRLKISLVDFNSFSKDQEHLDKCVVRIIDHHAKKRKIASKFLIDQFFAGDCVEFYDHLTLDVYLIDGDEKLDSESIPHFVPKTWESL